MTGTEAIDNAEHISKRLNQLCGGLRAEIEEMVEQWIRLGQAGGARDDHAAMLLNRLKPHLADIARFTAACEKQIEQIYADPFGERAA